MARWKIAPETANNSMAALADYDDTGVDYKITQDTDFILEEVKRDREILASGGKKEMGYRKMCTIPDIVAIEMLTKHNIDVHDPLFLHDANNMKRLKYVIQTEYPHLLIST